TRNNFRNTQTIRLAERVGFEPTVEFPLHTLSKRAPSTTRTSLRRLLESVVHGPVAEPVNRNCVRNCVRPPNVLGPLAVIWQSLATEGRCDNCSDLTHFGRRIRLHALQSS